MIEMEIRVIHGHDDLTTIHWVKIPIPAFCILSWWSGRA